MELLFIVVAAGKGKRFGFKKNKLLYEYNFKPLIAYTLENISKSKIVKKIILVASPEEIELFKKVVEDYNFNKVIAVIEGGKERQDSVYNALLWIEKNIKNKKDLFVAIHDGARVNLNKELIEKLYKKVLKSGSAVPVLTSIDTVKLLDKNGLIKKTLDRTYIGLAQTPQIFKFNLILDSYKKAMKENYYATDDSAILERYGKNVTTIEGNKENIKITFKSDLKYLSGFNTNLRTGIGFDVHKFKKGRELFLGGVHIPFKKGLAGHSDGDVLIHSIIDALLGAAGEQDIGQLFPDTNPEYKNIRSSELLKKVLKILKDKIKIINVDSVIICDQPMISNYKEIIRKNLADLLKIKITQINIKGKRTEGVIKQKGISAWTSVLVLKNDKIE